MAYRNTSSVECRSNDAVVQSAGTFLFTGFERSRRRSRTRQRADLELNEGYKLRAEEQVELAHRLGPQWADFSKSWRRYTPMNAWYGLSDGAVYYSMLTTLRPKHVVEVGSGFTSAIALDVREQEHTRPALTFIEPHSKRLLGLLKENDKTTTAIYPNAVQDIPIELFDVLAKDDILFIDSTHVSKPGSDVNWLFFRVPPRLQPGVVVHFHDNFSLLNTLTSG